MTNMIPPQNRSTEDITSWERHVQEMGQQMVFPATPDIAGEVRAKLARPRPHQQAISFEYVARIVVFLLVLGSAILLIPDVRATALEVFRIGVIRFDDESTLDEVTQTNPPLDSILDIPNETTLAQAESSMNFTVPSVLGEPDRVFMPVQDMAVLVWEKPSLTSLVVLGVEGIAKKYYPEAEVQMVKLGDRQAVWLEGEHILEFPPNQDKPLELSVTGNVLIWLGQGDVTYRLEGDLSLEEALRIAESGME